MNRHAFCRGYSCGIDKLAVHWAYPVGGAAVGGAIAAPFVHKKWKDEKKKTALAILGAGLAGGGLGGYGLGRGIQYLNDSKQNLSRRTELEKERKKILKSLEESRKVRDRELEEQAERIWGKESRWRYR